MELQKAGQVSKDFGISTRMLRYYEQVGLVKSLRTEDYAYRVYDENAITRLRQIIILRKLRVPVKQIISVLNNSDAVQTVEIFRQNISQLDKEITALSKVKSILERFVREICEKADVNLKPLGDEAAFSVISSLSFSDNKIKEIREDLSMEELNKASENITKLTDVRIIHLPPMTIAAVSAEGDECEGKALDIINRFVLERGLLRIKPDIRQFGFDCSQGATGIGENSHKYQVWVSIPEDMNVPEPLVKREFKGGLYAAHMIKMGNFDHWKLLHDWVSESDKYENDWSSVRCTPCEADMDRCLEESLNYWNNLQNPNFDPGNSQLDLLFPIREK